MKLAMAPLAFTCVLALSGCDVLGGTTGSERPRNNMNMQQAAEKADQILDETLDGIKPGVDWEHDISTDGGCPDSFNNATGAGSVTRRRAVMTVISTERRGNFLGVIERHWKKLGYEITSFNPSKKFPAVYASTPEDFRLGLKFGGEGQAFFSIATPCFKDSEVSPPKAVPGRKAYPNEEREPARPHIRDDFWSLNDPIPQPSKT